MDSLIEDNKRIIEGFRHAGEQIVLIDSDYEGTLQKFIFCLE